MSRAPWGPALLLGICRTPSLFRPVFREEAMSFTDQDLRDKLAIINLETCRTLWQAGSPNGTAEIWAEKAIAAGWELEVEEVLEGSFKHKGRAIEKKTTNLLAMEGETGQIALITFAEHNPDRTRTTNDAFRLLSSGGTAVRFAAFAAGPASVHWKRDPLTPSLNKLTTIYSELPETDWWRQEGPAKEGVEILFSFCAVDRGWVGAKRFCPPLDGKGFSEYSGEFFKLNYELEPKRIKIVEPETERKRGWEFWEKD